MRIFFLITNTGGMKYWSYLGTLETAPEYRKEIEKHGNIYVNRCGGYFKQDCVKEVHDVRIQEEWPKENPKNS